MTPSKFQREIYQTFQTTKDNITISAVAGSGKTTVLLELLKLVPKGKTALFLAFNNSIVDELKDRVDARFGVEVMTIHSYGWHSILCRYGSKAKVNPSKAIAKVERVLKKHPEINERKKGWYFYIVPKILDLLRCNLLDATDENIENISNYHDLIVGEKEKEIAIEVFKLMNKDKTNFDFMDMIYQPYIDSTIRHRKFDYVFCDESQDFSLAQQEIIRGALNRRGRLVCVGDENQAIYGFAGADTDSYNKLATLNGESVALPLSVCYRCARSIIIEAQELVPQIQWAPDAEMGIVCEGSLTDLRHGDWVLCRNLKPLVVTYLWLMKNKIKSKIKGKDIGEGIIALIHKTGAKSLSGLNNLLDAEKIKLVHKLKERGVKHALLHPKVELLEQRTDVIRCLMVEVNSVPDLIKMIQGIFTDDVKGIMLSTIHKAKGLENDRVFFLCPELIPSRFATQPWQYEQERNLKYVAITRAKRELIYVSGGAFRQDIESEIQL